MTYRTSKFKLIWVIIGVTRTMWNPVAFCGIIDRILIKGLIS